MKNVFSLDGKKAIVTGASRGMGRHIAQAYCEAGAEVVILSSSENIYRTAEELKQEGYIVYPIQVDLAEEKMRIQAFAQSIERLGGVDILVNNVGINKKTPSEEYLMKDWEYVMNVNLTATFHMSQLAGKYMLEHNENGRIINLASMLSYFGGYTVPAYAASKGGVVQLTKAMSNDWCVSGITVNCIAPGYMKTDMSSDLLDDSERYEKIRERIPMKRWGNPADIQGVAIFLASRASDYVTGAVIPVDGGYLVG